jgi:hypothetical protein
LTKKLTEKAKKEIDDCLCAGSPKRGVTVKKILHEGFFSLKMGCPRQGP